ncbi:MAG TPA: RDD family protein, partial [Anaeromyxobacteraceae bacterium]
GRRFGDVWAQTQVVDGKVASGTADEEAPASVAVGPGRWMSRTRDGRAARFRRRHPACASR